MAQPPMAQHYPPNIRHNPTQVPTIPPASKDPQQLNNNTTTTNSNPIQQQQQKQQQPPPPKTPDPVNRLHRAWRSLASNLLMAARATNAKGPLKPEKEKESEEALMATIRSRKELQKISAHIESHLRGVDGERGKALGNSLMTTPCCGIKRKRNL
eukprot:CAMPEP_0195509882 /NCGR_PEP_ID=MMETSP0794_2-20130614/2688_1 /TAXON_ID=515487 /ORGANISM="Stephanopyxis turris, Strain CCMP 815" /LENGTH=154 /DNA_ID=CAMNT_0040637197 /DNA_START=91 /DNA_END=555 /DNA_ORIENTATION=+